MNDKKKKIEKNSRLFKLLKKYLEYDLLPLNYT